MSETITPREASRMAWRSILPVTSRLKRRVCDIIESYGKPGLTSEQVEQFTGMKHQTVSARIGELAKDGLLVDCGVPAKTSSGRRAIAWMIARVEPEQQNLFEVEQ